MKLIVGIGNYGKEYKNTYHNMGFLALDYILGYYNLKLKADASFNAEVGELFLPQTKLIFCKPLTYVNLSGTAVRKIIDYYKIQVEDILVLVDDINLPFNSIRAREEGSSGGHNGLKNIEAVLGTSKYKRVRVGVGRNDVDAKEYVLHNFSKKELEVLEETFSIINNLLTDFINNVDFETIMAKYNKKII
ncbi:MAG: aminoacyl-tRNA hydrolase [Acholeplasmatales bacterium]|jgi:PTH1 family peptidyl-tRNA hydrolase|nr:aminoacyl-tRNA hydrolase [Acholeplasmatales bacterium]